MPYQLRVILDTKEDIFKDIVIDENKTLFEFHNFLKTAFALPGNELASFYNASDTWEQNEEEIPLENLTDEENILTMRDYTLKQILLKENDKLIYVYDLFDLWTFFVELVKIDQNKSKEDTKVLFSFGEMPKTAPEKNLNIFDTTNYKDREEEDDIFEDNDMDYDQEDLDGLSTYDSDDYNY